jgi:hypothetical protein
MGDRTLPTTAAVLRRGKFKLRHYLQPVLVAADACPGEGRGRTRPVRPAGCEIFRMRTHNVLPPREQAPHRIERPPASTGPRRPDGRMLAARCQSSHLSRLTGATANVPTQPWSNTPNLGATPYARCTDQPPCCFPATPTTRQARRRRAAQSATPFRPTEDIAGGTCPPPRPDLLISIPCSHLPHAIPTPPPQPPPANPACT